MQVRGDLDYEVWVDAEKFCYQRVLAVEIY